MAIEEGEEALRARLLPELLHEIRHRGHVKPRRLHPFNCGLVRLALEIAAVAGAEGHLTQRREEGSPCHITQQDA